MPEWGFKVNGTFVNTVPMVGTVDEAVTDGVMVITGVLV
jgi:hypothetical protein